MGEPNARNGPSRHNGPSGDNEPNGHDRPNRPHCVGALIFNDQGRVYVHRRASTRRILPGVWDIVGGHVEEGETPEDALAREIEEETGWISQSIAPEIAPQKEGIAVAAQIPCKSASHASS